MKTTNLFLAAMLSFVFSSCNDSIAATDLDSSNETNIEQMLQSMEFTSDSTSISQTERDGLVLMREEEKLAGDVYAYFYTLNPQLAIKKTAKTRRK